MFLGSLHRRKFVLEGQSFDKRALALVELCIERTKYHPFSFKFEGITTTVNKGTNTPTIPTIQSQYSIQILETLVAHADRWRTACLSADGDGLKKSLTKTKHRFGQLHSLQIRTFWPWERYDMPSDLFLDVPNLTRVHTTDFYQLHWSSITVLHINSQRHGTTDIFFAKLDKMTCLEELGRLHIAGIVFHLVRLSIVTRLGAIIALVAIAIDFRL